jgi:hypothetical protein
VKRLSDHLVGAGEQRRRLRTFLSRRPLGKRNDFFKRFDKFRVLGDQLVTLAAPQHDFGMAAKLEARALFASREAKAERSRVRAAIFAPEAKAERSRVRAAIFALCKPRRLSRNRRPRGHGLPALLCKPSVVFEVRR